MEYMNASSFEHLRVLHGPLDGLEDANLASDRRVREPLAVTHCRTNTTSTMNTTDTIERVRRPSSILVKRVPSQLTEALCALGECEGTYGV